MGTMTPPDDDKRRMQRVMMALADQAEAMPDAEILNDATAAGVNVQEQAEYMCSLLLDAAVRAKKQRLNRALKEHTATVAQLGRKRSRIPEDPQERKAMLDGIIARRPNVREAAVTLQHRELESFSESDVESVLRQLEALGALEEDEQDPK
jgi:hypothetical protein